MTAIKKERRNLLTKYVNEDTIEYINKTGSNPMAASNRKVTILFFDIRNSTGIAEILCPSNFATFLSEIFTDIMDLIYGNGGSVNKMLGDGIMATFGCPVSSGNDPLNAVNTALQIVEYLNTFNDVRPTYIAEPIKAGVGIATGIVFTGVIGSIHREEYAVLGDSVNIASRLESLTKKIVTSVLVDENTYKETLTDFKYINCYKGYIRGRKEPLKMYSL
ncbi:MAG: adenylate/guanylate cyclase domain-containing protein [Spirochaetaceae bacterium]